VIGQVPLPLPGGGTAWVGGGPFESCPPAVFGICLEERAANSAQSQLLLPIPDFGLPDLLSLRVALATILAQLPHRPVYIGCRAGLGRTGTVMACLARLSGIAEDPVVWVRRHYDSRAIETAAQEDFARHAVLRP
jgi:protein-tyrosine phosphatase